MKLNFDDPLDRLYAECINVRPSRDGVNTLLGPTRQYELLLLSSEINDDTEEPAA